MIILETLSVSKANPSAASKAFKLLFNLFIASNLIRVVSLYLLNLLYSSEGKITSLNRTKLGTSPVGTIVSSLIAGNLPNAKKNLSNACKISFVLGLFFKSVEQ